jgi:hypothetical protein
MNRRGEYGRGRRRGSPREAISGLPDGRAKGHHPGEFDPVQLRRGTEVELEHTTDPRLAQRIAMDHLVEDPLYYVKLARMHID